ncbi:hypothetical protein BLOT_014526 [Blomia tropicalis]|nr:hypothetical protein BLOT_014526 [Blomia tropicalis]
MGPNIGWVMDEASHQFDLPYSYLSNAAASIRQKASSLFGTKLITPYRRLEALSQRPATTQLKPM